LTRPVTATTTVEKLQQRPERITAATRLNSLTQETGGSSRSMMDPNPPKKGMLSKKSLSAAAAGGRASRLFWERVTKVGVCIYLTYSLLFPVRVMIAPIAFTLMARAMNALGLLSYEHRRGPF
jgi:hypothetical protein